MNETIDIIIEEWIIDFFEEFSTHPISIELRAFLHRAIKTALIPEINSHYHGHIVFENMSLPAQQIYKRWEEYHIAKNGGGIDAY